MRHSTRKRAPAERVIDSFVSAVFMIVALSYIYILVWTFISSLKTHTEIVMDPFSLPEKWQWSNYLDLIEKFTVNGHSFWEMLFNSLWFSVVGAFLAQIVTVTFAYTCTMYDFPGSKLIYSIILVMIALPIYGNSGAVYRIYYNLGLIDSYAHVLASMSGFSIWFLYYRAYFKNISSTYAEAASIDGANDFQIYFKIMLPQAKPIFGACFLTTWLSSWNNYESALVYLPNLPTMAVGIYKFNVEMVYNARLDILFAACMVVSIPALVIFIIFNKTLTESISVGGIKG